jgi:hypothetical protein
MEVSQSIEDLSREPTNLAFFELAVLAEDAAQRACLEIKQSHRLASLKTKEGKGKDADLNVPPGTYSRKMEIKSELSSQPSMEHAQWSMSLLVSLRSFRKSELTEILNDVWVVEILEELDLTLESGDGRDLTSVGSIGSSLGHLDLLNGDHFARCGVKTEVNATVLGDQKERR